MSEAADPIRRSRVWQVLRAGLYGLAVLVAIAAIATQFRVAILRSILPDLLRSQGIPADGLAVESVDAGGLTLTDIALANGRMRIGRLRVDWSPLAWLDTGPRAMIRHVAAEDVDAEVVIDPDGRFRLAGLEALMEGGSEGSTGELALPFETASLERLVLRLSTGLGDAVLRASLTVRHGADGSLRISGSLSPEGFGGTAELPLSITFGRDGRIRGDVEIAGGTWRTGGWRVAGLSGWASFDGSLSEGIDSDLFIEAGRVSRADIEIGLATATISVRRSRPTRLLMSAETGFGSMTADVSVADWSPVEPRATVDLAFAEVNLAEAGEVLAAGMPALPGTWTGRVNAELPLAPLVRGDPVARVVAETDIVSRFTVAGRGVEIAGRPVDAIAMRGVAVRRGSGAILMAGRTEASSAGLVVRGPLQLHLDADADRTASGGLRARLLAGMEILDGEGPPRFVVVDARAIHSTDGWRADAVVRPDRQSFDLPGVGKLEVQAEQGLTLVAEGGGSEAQRVNLSFTDSTVSLGQAALHGAAGFVDIDLRTSDVAGRLTWKEASVPGGSVPSLSGSVTATVLAGRLEGIGSIAGPVGLSAEFQVDHDAISGEGSAVVSLPTFRFDPNGARAAAAFPALARTGFRAIAGSMAGRAVLTWGSDPTQQAEFRLTDVGVASDYGAAAGLSGVVRLDRLWPVRTAGPATIDIPVLDFGAIMTEGRLRIAIDGDRLRISEARFDWAGGRVSFEPITTSLGAVERRIVLRLEGLDLEKVLEEAPVEGLLLTGRVSGHVPLRLARDTIAFEDATITSEGSGTLRYAFGSGAGLAETDASLALLVSALQDFRYESLVVTLNGALGSDLTAGVRINGANPALYEGYPIALNVNVTGALDSILRRSLETAEIGRRAQEYYQRQVRGR